MQFAQATHDIKFYYLSTQSYFIIYQSSAVLVLRQICLVFNSFVSFGTLIALLLWNRHVISHFFAGEKCLFCLTFQFRAFFELSHCRPSLLLMQLPIDTFVNFCFDLLLIHLCVAMSR